VAVPKVKISRIDIDGGTPDQRTSMTPNVFNVAALDTKK
jgi:hypothetical protein